MSFIAGLRGLFDRLANPSGYIARYGLSVAEGGDGLQYIFSPPEEGETPYLVGRIRDEVDPYQLLSRILKEMGVPDVVLSTYLDPESGNIEVYCLLPVDPARADEVVQRLSSAVSFEGAALSLIRKIVGEMAPMYFEFDV